MRSNGKTRPASVRPETAKRSLADEILEIGKRCAGLPDLDHRTPEEILDYDEHGLPR